MSMKLVIVALMLSFANVARANVTLPDVVSSGMVLQRDQAVPIWGTANPGEAVTVSFEGQKKSTTADASGRWLIRLRPLKATATPTVLIVEGRNKIELQDILVGEVWLVAGQSNMLGATYVFAVEVKKATS